MYINVEVSSMLIFITYMHLLFILCFQNTVIQAWPEHIDVESVERRSPATRCIVEWIAQWRKLTVYTTIDSQANQVNRIQFYSILVIYRTKFTFIRPKTRMLHINLSNSFVSINFLLFLFLHAKTIPAVVVPNFTSHSLFISNLFCLCMFSFNSIRWFQ